jgi:hypothetical protein
MNFLIDFRRQLYAEVESREDIRWSLESSGGGGLRLRALWEGDRFVVGDVVLEAVVEAAEHAVVEVAQAAAWPSPASRRLRSGLWLLVML